jgi:hypothetical protein
LATLQLLSIYLSIFLSLSLSEQLKYFLLSFLITSLNSSVIHFKAMATFLIVIVALFGAATAGPLTLRGLEPIESDCVQQCTIDFRTATVNVEFAKMTDYGAQLVNLNKTCKSVAEGWACMERCHVAVNPLDIPALNIMCDGSRREEVAMHETCYADNYEHVSMICDEKCGAHLTTPHDIGGRPRKPTKQETATACTRSRCHASCSRDAFTELCKTTDPAAGLYLQQFFIEVLEAVNEGLVQEGLMPFVLERLPKECHAMFSPLEFFSFDSLSAQ